MEDVFQQAKSVNENIAAEILGCTVSCLRAWRQRGRGPSFVRLGRMVRYPVEDIKAFLNSNRVVLAHHQDGRGDRIATKA
jgi:hypothetical protein